MQMSLIPRFCAAAAQQQPSATFPSCTLPQLTGLINTPAKHGGDRPHAEVGKRWKLTSGDNDPKGSSFELTNIAGRCSLKSNTQE